MKTIPVSTSIEFRKPQASSSPPSFPLPLPLLLALSLIPYFCGQISQPIPGILHNMSVPDVKTIKHYVMSTQSICENLPANLCLLIEVFSISITTI